MLNIYAQCYVECSLHTIQSVHHKFTHYTFFIHPVHTYMHKSYIIEIKKKHLTIANSLFVFVLFFVALFWKDQGYRYVDLSVELL